MFWIAFAAQVSTVRPDRDVRSLFSYEDVRLDLVPDGEWKRVGVRVTVDPMGKVQTCQAEYPSGNRQLDAYTCELIRQRARFRPPVAPDGQPIYRVVRTNIIWRVDADAPPDPGDIDLTISQLPNGVRNPAFVMITLLIDENGHPMSCLGEEPYSVHASKSPPQLKEAACTELLRSYAAIPAIDQSGRRVRSVQDALVRFSLDNRR